MPDLYLANCTIKTIDFNFYQPGHLPWMQPPGADRRQIKPMVRFSVPPGQQQRIARDVGAESITEIIVQHQPYGFVLEDEIVHADRSVCIEGIFGVGKAVSPDSIMLAQEHNHNVLTGRGIDLRRAAAIGMSNFMNQGGVTHDTTQIEIVEEAARGQTPSINETVRVDRRQSQGLVVGRRAA